VGKAVEGGWDVIWHGHVHCSIAVVPIEGDDQVFIACPVVRDIKSEGGGGGDGGCDISGCPLRDYFLASWAQCVVLLAWVIVVRKNGVSFFVKYSPSEVRRG